ncbi:MAG: hypothetical protein M1825_005148 [Sarcosagium campestre]|nr:MAG: hypothetical protein M1825_005148 [Sarcosagium campestre]
MAVEKNKSKAAVHWTKRLECPVDENANYHNTLWCNRDLIPIPPERRTWTWVGYFGYWIIAGVNPTAWAAGSSLLALGLSVGQAMGTVVGASLFIAILSVVLGWMGSHHYIGFTVLSRASWGILGSFWPILNRVVTGTVWMGIQLYWGGQATVIILSAIIGPKFAYMKNTLPESANVTTQNLVGFFIFLFIFAPTLLVRPEHLQMPFRVAFVMIVSTIFGLLIWALCDAHGAGTLIHTGAVASGSVLSWNTVFGLQSFVGAYGTGCMGQSDWTRYARTPNAALFGQAITAPLAICITALVGLLVTSATYDKYGATWNPLLLLLQIQQQSMSPGARAGTFFAGLGIFASQLSLCIVLNSVAAGMDLAALCPKFINIRRGSYILTVIAVASCPWTYVSTSSIFIKVLSSWSVFLSPMTGIFVSDYFLVRKQQFHLSDLYVGNSTSAYWYTFGLNWRAVVAWAFGLWPLLPGFVRNVQGVSSGNGWDHIYNLSYFYGFLSAFLLYRTLFYLAPMERQTGSSPFLLEHHRDGALDSSSSQFSKHAEV